MVYDRNKSYVFKCALLFYIRLILSTQQILKLVNRKHKNSDKWVFIEVSWIKHQVFTVKIWFNKFLCISLKHWWNVIKSKTSSNYNCHSKNVVMR